MKKFLKFVISLLLFISLSITFTIPLLAYSGSGQGTEASPYIITNTAQLNEVRNNLTAFYKLNNDIDLNNQNFVPISSYTAQFKGAFDGAGFTIKNLNISQSTADYVGLFGYTNAATIKNVDIENVSISGNLATGALVGFAYRSTVDNCNIIGTGSVNGVSYTGGLIGYSSGSIINASSAEITVNASSSFAGGLIGTADNSIRITKCYATGNVTSGAADVGGLLGRLYNTAGSNSEVTECYATGNVIGTFSIGGLIGWANTDSGSSTEISDCYATGSATGSINYIGGDEGGCSYPGRSARYPQPKT